MCAISLSVVVTRISSRKGVMLLERNLERKYCW